MPRKYKNKKDLRTIDENSQEYWDEILRREGLGVDRGRNTDKLAYVGGSNALEIIQEEKKRSGRSGPKPQAD